MKPPQIDPRLSLLIYISFNRYIKLRIRELSKGKELKKKSLDPHTLGLVEKKCGKTHGV